MHPIIAVFDSPFDLGALLVIVLLLFGSTQLPKLARSLGSAQREFRKGVADGQEAVPVVSAVTESDTGARAVTTAVIPPTPEELPHGSGS